MEYHNLPSPPSSNKAKHRHHYLTACFRSSADDDAGGYRSLSDATSLIRSPSTWLRSKNQELPKLAESGRGLFSGACGGGGGARHRRRHSGDFRYDPLSYALNFDEDAAGEAENRNLYFWSRLPASPPPPPLAKEAPL